MCSDSSQRACAACAVGIVTITARPMAPAASGRKAGVVACRERFITAVHGMQCFGLMFGCLRTLPSAAAVSFWFDQSRRGRLGGELWRGLWVRPSVLSVLLGWWWWWWLECRGFAVCSRCGCCVLHLHGPEAVDALLYCLETSSGRRSMFQISRWSGIFWLASACRPGCIHLPPCVD